MSLNKQIAEKNDVECCLRQEIENSSLTEQHLRQEIESVGESLRQEMAETLMKYQQKESELKLVIDSTCNTSNILDGLKKELDITREH